MKTFHVEWWFGCPHVKIDGDWTELWRVKYEIPSLRRKIRKAIRRMAARWVEPTL